MITPTTQREAEERAKYEDWWHEGAHPFRDISKRKNCQLNEETAWVVWQAALASPVAAPEAPTLPKENKLALYPLEEVGCEDAPDDRKLFRVNDWQLTVGDVRAARSDASTGAAPEAPASEQQATCWSCTKPYTLEQRANADGNCPHCGVEIELATPAATTASATDQAKAAHVAWRDKKDGRATAPSRNATPLDDIRAIAAKYGHEIGEVCALEIAAALTQQSAAQAPQGDSFKPVYWWSVLLKCARLLDLPDDEPIPSGVVRAVEELVAAQAAHAGADTERALYACKGKGGEYVMFGHSNGAGTKRGEIIVVYHPTNDDSILYHRAIADFDERMERIDRAAMSAATEQKEKP